MADQVVRFDGIDASGVVVIGPDELEVTVPPHAVGTVDVRVIAGARDVTGTGAYTYAATELAATLNPNAGSTTGGTAVRVLVTGDNRGAVTAITVDGLEVAFEAVGGVEGAYDITTPAHRSGIVSVRVAAGTESAAATFSYLAPAQYDTGHTIFLQLSDGSVDAVPCTAGADARHVVLSRPPRLPLQVDAEMFARTTYQIVPNISVREQAFLVQEKEGRQGLTCVLRAVAYDDRYYQNDHDAVTEDALPWSGGAGEGGGGGSDPDNMNPNLIADGTFDLGTGWAETEEPPARASIANGKAVLEYASIFDPVDKLYLDVWATVSRTFTVPAPGDYFLGVELSQMQSGERCVAVVSQGGVTVATVDATANGWTTGAPFALIAGVATITLLPERTDGSHVSGNVAVETVEVRAPAA